MVLHQLAAAILGDARRQVLPLAFLQPQLQLGKSGEIAQAARPRAHDFHQPCRRLPFPRLHQGVQHVFVGLQQILVTVLYRHLLQPLLLLLGPCLFGRLLLFERGFLPHRGDVLQARLQVLVFGQQALNEIQRKRHRFVFTLPRKPLHHQLVHEIQMVVLLHFGAVALVGILPSGHDVLPVFAPLINGGNQAPLLQFVLFLQVAVMLVDVGEV